MTRPRTSAPGEREIVFRSQGLRLAGTLTIPDAAAEGVPAALLISGSGPLDRDSNHKGTRLDVMRQIAVGLADSGIASLRYDRRGIAGSDGDYMSAGLWDNLEDARAALAGLRTRPELDPERIVVIGHSEGAIHAAHLAAEVPGLAGAVLLAGPAQPGRQVLQWQGAQVHDSLPGPLRKVMGWVRFDMQRMQTKSLDKMEATTTDVARIQGSKVNAKWFREFLACDPADALRAIEVPVLALTGDKDIQVDPGDITAMATLIDGDFTGSVVPDMTHLLRHQTGSASLLRYRSQLTQPVDPRVIVMISDWIKAR